MADYGTYEGTRQGAQPAELYKFFWGGQSVAGTSAGDIETGSESVFGSTLPSCEGTAAPTATVVEAWTGGDDTDIGTPSRALSGGTGSWVNETGGFGTWNIASGVAVPSVGGFPVCVVTGSGLGNDQSVSVTGKFTSNPSAGSSAFFTALARHATGEDKAYTLHCNLKRDGGGALTGTVLLATWNDPDYYNIQEYVTTAFTLNTEVTIRLDVVGTKLYGYLNDTLVVFGTDTVRTSGDPGIYGAVLSGDVAVTRWAAANAADPGNDETVVGYIRDHWDGADQTEINGRELDGGGSSCLAQAEWVKCLPRPEVHGDIVDNTLHVTERTDLDPLTWAHYVATGIANLPDDYRIESTVDLTAMPLAGGPGAAANDVAWASLLARYASDDESGYEFAAQFVPSAANGGTGDGGMAFSIYRTVSESYTHLVDTDTLYLTGEVALGEHTIAMHVSGTRICGYFDGELVAVAVDPLNLYPTGLPGICLNGDEVTVTSWTVYAGDLESQPCGPGDGVGVGGSNALNYTSADVEIVYEGETYVPFIAHRTNFTSGSGERTAAEIELSLPFDHPVSTLAMTGRGPIGCIVYRLDRQDTTDGAAAIPLQGQIIRHRIDGRWCVITLGNVGTLLNRKLPRMLTQRQCPHVFGGPFCQRNLTDITYTNNEVMTPSLGRVIVVDGAASHASANNDPTFFEQGVLITSDGTREYIEAQEGDTLTLRQPMPGLEEGDMVTLQGGCRHTAQACDLLGNIAHFGGEIGMPDRNPFTGAGLIGTNTTVDPT